MRMQRTFQAIRSICFFVVLVVGLWLGAAAASGHEPFVSALHPGAYLPQVASVPLAPRLPGIENKTIYLITINSPKDPAMDSLADRVEKMLTGRFAKVIHKIKTTAYNADDKPLWEEIKKNGNAFVYFATAQSSTTMYAGQWSAALEKNGVPGVVAIFDLFEPTAQATSEKLGTMLRTVSVPMAFDKASDKQLSDIMDKIIKAITTPLNKKETMTGMYTPRRPPRIAIKGTEEKVRKYFMDQGFTDGLPIVIPTAQRVAAMLKGTSHKPEEVVSRKMPPNDYEVTVEKVAINGVMAGCKPEYMPVLLAAVQAFVEGDNGGGIVSTNSFSFMMLVNGPMRSEIGMNAGVFALGPGNQANASIGRALRLFTLNLGGGKVGENIMGTQGNVSLYSFCFPENEEGSPWEPYHVSQGYKREESTVTIFSGGWSHAGNYMFSEGHEKLSRAIAQFEYPNGVVILMSPPKARQFSSKGLSKQDVEERIWSSATVTMREFKDSTYYRSFIEPVLKGGLVRGEQYIWPKEYLGKPDDAIVQVYPRKYVKVVVVGGEINDVAQGWKMAGPSTASIDKWR
ncbi:MAG TPA: hypothetical protein VMT62_12400 [Syntrophorhabdaceae bacterium]|nr:hypothetical protein [Syntrophorhabdaceae bacterium]